MMAPVGCLARQRSRVSDESVADKPRRTSRSVEPEVTMQFPMFVVKIVDFRHMTAAKPHQRLLAQGVLEQHSRRDGGPVVFVSHEWCGRSRPDPHFRQLRVLQGVFARAASGDLRVEGDLRTLIISRVASSFHLRDFEGCMSWHMWYDYFSIPQPEVESDAAAYTSLTTDLGRAVASLSAYVQACRHFLVLAPTVQHEDRHMLDYTTWKARGWCRFERLSLVLATEDRRMLVVRRVDAVAECGTQDYIFEPLGTGAFKYEGDKARLAIIAQRLLDTKLECLLAAGRLPEYRSLCSLRSSLLEGLPVVPEVVGGFCTGEGKQDGFLQRMRLPSFSAKVAGTTPLLLASRSGDVRAIEACVQAGASLERAEKRTHLNYSVRRGQRPLHAAAVCGHAEAVSALLRLRADLAARTADHISAMHTAAASGKSAVIRTLLEHRAQLEQMTVWGLTPLMVSVVYGRQEGVQFLLEARAAPVRTGVSPLNLASLFNSGVPIVRLLLDAHADIDHRATYRKGVNRGNLLMRLMALQYSLGWKGYARSICYHMPGSTPLVSAVASGAVAEARELLAAGADPTLRNARGLDAMTLAMHLAEENLAEVRLSHGDAVPSVDSLIS
mmetsp:Transcript_47191/g.132704  ORF Transcript_47191/g.132704 Transcript_47191/m.132704 type:complete len:612 (-) Transcript_47191:139-1974(-)